MDMQKHYRYRKEVKEKVKHNKALCHLLIYHALDITTVAARWWDGLPLLQRLLTPPGADNNNIRAWLLFFYCAARSGAI